MSKKQHGTTRNHDTGSSHQTRTVTHSESKQNGTLFITHPPYHNHTMISLPSQTVPNLNAIQKKHTPIPLSPRHQAPCLAFSAQINAIIRLSSALCANCSCFVWSSTSSLAAMSLDTVSMRFCSASSLDKVLSRKGAEKVMLVGEAPELGRRISSLRGGFLEGEGFWVGWGWAGCGGLLWGVSRWCGKVEGMGMGRRGWWVYRSSRSVVCKGCMCSCATNHGMCTDQTRNDTCTDSMDADRKATVDSGTLHLNGH